MGLLRAGMGAVGGVLADLWREYFYCARLASDTLVAKGHKRTSAQAARQHAWRGQHHLRRIVIAERGPVHDRRQAGRRGRSMWQAG